MDIDDPAVRADERAPRPPRPRTQRGLRRLVPRWLRRHRPRKQGEDQDDGAYEGFERAVLLVIFAMGGAALVLGVELLGRVAAMTGGG